MNLTERGCDLNSVCLGLGAVVGSCEDGNEHLVAQKTGNLLTTWVLACQERLPHLPSSGAENCDLFFAVVVFRLW
jgi:hypothetical protein